MREALMANMDIIVTFLFIAGLFGLMTVGGMIISWWHEAVQDDRESIKELRECRRVFRMYSIEED